MKIDFYTHILPQKYYAALQKKNIKILDGTEKMYPNVIDVATRMRLMNRYPDVLQVITVMQPPLEEHASPQDALELARIANDEIAELVVKYPDKFYAAVACLPMNDMDAALAETDRAITQLGLKGVQIYSRIHGETLDQPKFRPLFEKMAKYDLPIWIHPVDHLFSPKTGITPEDAGVLNLVYETSYAMQKIVMGGIFRDYPNLKIITHHCGAIIPILEGRLFFPDQFKKFYCDTATYGATSPIMGAYNFFGPDHVLFGSDSPLGPKYGCTLDIEQAIERMSIPDIDKEKIFLKNAENLLKIAL